MAGGRGAPEAGELRELRPEPRRALDAEKTVEAMVFKLQAQMIRKQLQVGCSAASALGEPRRHADMLAMQVCLCNRCQFSLATVPSTYWKHIRTNLRKMQDASCVAFILLISAEIRCLKGHILSAFKTCSYFYCIFNFIL